ncbi:MAG: low affinity iron permease family protein [Bacteroidota bacterium]|nr:low affinity iron permease family protein [Bacteroidota bacterium]
MKSIYRKVENAFEKFSIIATRVLGNSITFIIAFSFVIYYFADDRVYHQTRNKMIMDVIFSVTFLSIFIIQKTVNRFSVALHLKINELVAAHDKASNRMINVEDKTEEELQELSRHYSSLVEKINSSKTAETSHSIDTILEDQDNKEK